MWNDMLTYFAENSASYWTRVVEHIALSAQALLISMLIALPLGYWSSRKALVKFSVTFLAQSFRVIPSLAVLFILIPFLGVGRLPALVALSFLAIPPLLVQTTLGFSEIPEVLTETGRGLGMTDWQLLRQVQLPLAKPYILTGIKLALVEIIASATLATYIGAGGLGSIIFTGLSLLRTDLMLIGGGSVAMLSLLTMLVFDLLIKERD